MQRRLASTRLLVTFLALASLSLTVPGAAGAAPSPKALFARSDNRFALDLLHQHGAGNLVLSPFSVLTALAMVDAGAAGRTARQIQHVLHASSAAKLDRGAAALLADLEAQPPRNGTPEEDIPQLDIANGLWLQQGLTVQPAFLGTLQNSFGAPPQPLDFQGNPEPARNTINAWIAARTAGLIPELMSRGSISSATRLVLANAIYLKARWESEFKPDDTAPAPFTTIGGQQRSTTFMAQAADGLPYGQGNGYRAVELPYRDSELSMLLVMPGGSGFAAFQWRLDTRVLQRIVSSLHPRNVNLRMPRFHLSETLELNSLLIKLGMPLAFSEEADFSGIAPVESLRISQVRHAADLQVDEKGTVAAAATGISVEATAVQIREHVVELTLDHPFLFFLRDDRSGAILFTGRLVEPGLPA